MEIRGIFSDSSAGLQSAPAILHLRTVRALHLVLGSTRPKSARYSK